MRAVVWVLLLASLAVALTLAARFDDGYVLVVYPPWRVEMSFMLALAVLLGLYFLFGLLFTIVRMTLSLPADVRAWREQRRRHKSEDELSRAVAALISGQPAHARKLAAKAQARRATPLAALVAARAAAELGQAEEAREQLKGVTGDVGELIAGRQAVERQLAAAANDDPGAKPEGN